MPRSRIWNYFYPWARAEELQEDVLDYQRRMNEALTTAGREPRPQREASMPGIDIDDGYGQDELTDVERSILSQFTARQLQNIFNVTENYLTSYGPDSDSATRSIHTWIRNEWGNNIAYSITGIVIKMVKKKLSEADKPKPPFLSRTFKQALGARVKAAKGEIGLELEVEGKDLFNSPVEYWTAVGDGSLRTYKDSPPLEYVLREPVSRKEVEPALKYLADRLKMNKSEIHMSHRCSVHVHVNVQQTKMQHLINFMTLYYIFEDVLMQHAAPERRGNLFCLRAKDASFQIENMANAIRSGQWDVMMQNDMRYSAMNPAALAQHGSLEFRAMRGTVDVETIKDWVTILLALKDSATTFTNPASISRIYKSLGEKEFLFRVFDSRIPPEILSKWAKDKLTPERISEGYYAVRDAMFAVDWSDPPEHLVATGATRKNPLLTTVREEPDFDEEDD